MIVQHGWYPVIIEARVAEHRVLMCSYSDNGITKKHPNVSEVPPGYLLLVSFMTVRLATVLLGTFKTCKTNHNYF